MRFKQLTWLCGSSPSTRTIGRTVNCDTQARLLETVVVIFESGDEMVIHAMPARRQFWELLP